MYGTPYTLSKHCLLGSLVLALACSFSFAQSNQASDREHRVANGAWGGQHIRLNVTDEGAAVEFDCAHGHIDGPLVFDDKGQFNITGSFTAEHGGPVRRDEAPAEQTARYIGTQEGSTIKLKVVTAGGDVIGNFLLNPGAVKLTKCR